MKKLFILLFVFCSITALGQYPITAINITLPSQPAASTADWANSAVPLMISAQSQLVQGQVPGQVVESRILVTIKNSGNKICGTYTSSNAPRSNFNKASMVWSAGSALSLLGQDCTLPPGTYQICVQFFSGYAPVQPLSNEVCKTFSIQAPTQEKFTPPQNLLPVDGKVFSEAESNQPITLRWT